MVVIRLTMQSLLRPRVRLHGRVCFGLPCNRSQPSAWSCIGLPCNRRFVCRRRAWLRSALCVRLYGRVSAYRTIAHFVTDWPAPMILRACLASIRTLGSSVRSCLCLPCNRSLSRGLASACVFLLCPCVRLYGRVFCLPCNRSQVCVFPRG